MAVELTKVALWIETVDPGLPLGFFDAQIRCGDALLGVFDLQVLQDGIPDAAYKPLTGDDKETAKYYLKANRDAKTGQGGFDFGTGRASMPTMKPLALDFSGFRDLPEDTVEQISAKAKRFKELCKGQAFVRAAAAADLYVAAFLLPKVGGAPAGTSERTVPTTEELWMALNQGKMREAMVEATKVARNSRALHWPLEFPDVMQLGGFDVVLGNPPWEVVQLSDIEFFATLKPEIAALAGVARKKAIADLQKSDPATYAEFVVAKRISDASNEFARESGRFPLTAAGKMNTYALFAELFSNLAHGRAGIIVPTGIATDATTAPFFASLVDAGRLSRLTDFENRSPIFPSVHRSFKFCLITLARGAPLAKFSFFLTAPSQMAEPDRNFTLTPDQIAQLNPNTKTAPVFRSRADAELTAKIYLNSPVLWHEGAGTKGNPWNVDFRQGLFNMTSDSQLFRTADQLLAEGFTRAGADWAKDDDNFVPLYEAKMIHQFDHRWSGYAENGSDGADIDLADKSNPYFDPAPRYWVPLSDVNDRLSAKNWTRKWLMGWRDITNATNERTVIATIFPKLGAGDTLLLKMPSIADARLCAANIGNLCSLVLDYAARQKIGGTHMKYNIFKQLPVLPPKFYTEPRLAFVTPKVLELTYTSHSLAPFARDLGHDGPPFAWDEDRRALLRADLDAFYARAYGLTREELRYILDPADVKGPDYPSETFRVLKEKEIRQYGEYRTRGLVLSAWDRMDANGEFAAMGM